jgi:hypothetical protein
MAFTKTLGRALPLVWAAAAAVLLVAACGGTQPSAGSGGGTPAPADSAAGGDIPDTQAYVPVHVDAGHFTVKVPEGWARTDKAGVTRFSSKLDRITLEAAPAAAAPTVESAKSQEVPTISAAAKAFQLDQVTAVQRPAGTVILITYRADSAPDPVTGKVGHDAVERYEFWRSGTTAVVTLAAPAGSDNVDPWKTITDSFTWD